MKRCGIDCAIVVPGDPTLAEPRVALTFKRLNETKLCIGACQAPRVLAGATFRLVNGAVSII